MENIENIFCGNEKSNYMIVKMKGEEKLRIFSKNEEIFLEKKDHSCVYCSEISEILFKLTVVINSIWFRKKAIQDIYYNLIASVICLCLTLDKSTDYDELKKNIDEELNYISGKLDDEIIANNKLIYFRTYIIYLVIFTLVSIIILALGLKLIKELNSSGAGTINIIKSMNMSALGGLIALYFKMNDNQFFKSSFLAKNYVLFSLARGIYSSCVGIAGYYIFLNYLTFLNNTKPINEPQLYFFTAALGYSTKFIPSFFNKIVDEKSTKKNQE